jgi:hypothetical protein
MKKTLLIAAALGALAMPALAQQSPTGTNAGGPGRVGIPGQIGGGVPGQTQNVAPGETQARAATTHRARHTRKSRHSRKHM